MHDTIEADPTSGGGLAVPVPGPTRITQAIEAAREWLLARSPKKAKLKVLQGNLA